MNSTTLEQEQSKRNSVGQRFLFQHGAYVVSVCLQKNKVTWKGCTQSEGRRNRREMSRIRGCDIVDSL